MLCVKLGDEKTQKECQDTVLIGEVTCSGSQQQEDLVN